MKKLALIPLMYDEYNYGGVLQFYALQRALKKEGYEVEILKVNAERRVCELPAAPVRGLPGYLRRIVSVFHSRANAAFINRTIRNRKKNIDDFKERYYAKTIDMQERDINQYFAVVCGSDQIWNPNWARERAFLTFVPDHVNKVIYAASLGCATMTEHQKKIFKPLVDRLDHVSVREYSGKQLLETFVDRNDIEVVLDPTLLLRRDEWEQIVEAPQVDQYIFTYFLGECGEYRAYVEQFAQEKGMKIVNIPFASGERIDNDIFGDVKIVDASPEQFLGLIKNAEYVFTDSFHACVFSVLFHKSFYAFRRKAGTNMLDRIVTLQQNLQLPNRIISVDTDISQEQQIDYTQTDFYQDALIEQSLAYIRKSLHNEE